MPTARDSTLDPHEARFWHELGPISLLCFDGVTKLSDAMVRDAKRLERLEGQWVI